MCAWEQAKALAFREAGRVLHGEAPSLPWIASHVAKNDGTHPTRQALHKFFAAVDADPDWFPGKHNGKKRGPPPLFTRAKRQRCAKVMMALKHSQGDEPSLSEMKVQCKRSTVNPQTGVPFDDKVLRRVLTEDCYDLDPEHPWRFQPRLQKRFLSQKVTGQRLAMCTQLLGPTYAHCTPGWFHRHVVWMDPCSSILPGNKAQWLAMKQAAKGAKGYISDNAMMENANLRGPATALKQKTFVGRKMNWVILLARGRVAVRVLPVEWQLNGEGMAEVAGSLTGWLRDLLGPDAHLPRVVFTDRGTGMFSPAGHILPRYDGALRAAGLRSFFGADATAQAPDMGDLLLHETAVSWVRNRLRRMRPQRVPWEETVAQWAKRMSGAVAYANAHHKVDDLCRAFPARLDKCVAVAGGRLRT